MWNEPTLEELAQLPRFYTTENTPLKDKLIHMHFFIGACDWYAAEYSSDDRLFFGHAILNSDLLNAEWGYFGLDELREISVRGIEIDRDLHWRQMKAYDVDKIREAHQAQRIW